MADTTLGKGAGRPALHWIRLIQTGWKSRRRSIWWRVLADSFSHLNDDDGWALASHVALSALMSIFPFLIFVTALAGFIGNTRLAGSVADILFATWPPTIAGPIAAEVHRVVAGASGSLLTISAVIAVYLASNGVAAVRAALNRAYRATEQRSFFVLQIQSLIFVIIGAVAGLPLAFLGVLGPIIFAEILRRLPQLSRFAGIFPLIRFGVTGSLVVVVLVAAHVWLPAGRPRVRKLWPGIGLTLVLWVAAAMGLAAYIGSFANYAATYAGLTSAVTAIFFLYVVALLMIMGAEFNAALCRGRQDMGEC